MIFTEGFNRSVIGDNTHWNLKWNGVRSNLSGPNSSNMAIVPGRFSGNCLAWTTGNQYWGPSLTIPSDSHYILGMAIQPTAVGSSQTRFFGTYTGTSTRMAVVMSSTGVLQVKLGTTTMYTAPQALPLSQWFYIEVEHSIASSGGLLNVWINDVLVCTFTGDTTGGVAGTTIDNFRPWDSLWIDYMAFCAIDDLYYITSSGSTPRWTDTHVKEFSASADASNSGWTLSVGSDIYTILDNDSSSTGTPNLVATTVGSKFLVDTADVVAASVTIHAVAVNTRASKSDAGAKNGVNVLNISATDYLGTDAALVASDGFVYDAFALNPATSAAWTKSDVEALKFGFKVTA